MAYDNAITREGAAPLQPEQVAVPSNRHGNRHVQTGRFIRKGASPIKRSGTKKLRRRTANR
jgi:hypothetical protein